MGLLTIVRKIKQKEKELRILMLGLDNAGKTTIVKKLLGEDVNTISPTLGFNIDTLYYQDHAVNIWDVGGQKSLRSYWKNYFEKTDGLIWVVDSADLRRLRDCKEELNILLQEERLQGASLLIFANKQDVPGALSLDDISKVLEIETISRQRHCNIIGCSAIRGDGIVEGFDWIVKDIGERLYMLN